MSTRRVVRNCLLALILPALVVVPVAGYRWQVDREGRAARAAVIARIEATDPRWRWEDIEADRPAVPDVENSVRIVEQFNELAERRFFQPSDPDTGRPIINSESPNRLLNPVRLRKINEALADTESVRSLIDSLSRRPRGRVDLVPTDNWAGLLVPHEQNPYGLVGYLECESERLVHTSDHSRQARLIRALLNLSRIEGNGRFDLGYLFRLSESVCAARRLERALATNTFDGRLEEFQTEFQKQADADIVRPAVRRIRASYEWVLQTIERGDQSLYPHLYGPAGNHPGVREIGKTWLYRPHMKADWATALDVATRALQIVDSPEAQWMSTWAAGPLPPLDDQHPFSGGCTGYIEKLLKRALETRAILRCSVVSLAAEQYRMRTGGWPPDLDAIPKSILADAPADPLTGGALSYARTADGVTISSTGLRTPFRLYDPGQRRLPPLPAKDDN